MGPVPALDPFLGMLVNMGGIFFQVTNYPAIPPSPSPPPLPISPPHHDC